MLYLGCGPLPIIVGKMKVYSFYKNPVVKMYKNFKNPGGDCYPGRGLHIQCISAS